MKIKSKDPKNKWVQVRMTQAQYESFYALYKQSTCRSISEYFRRVTLRKTVTLKYRHESADEILSALLKMKNELNGVGNYLNNAVHELHVLDQIPGFRNWIKLYENLPQTIQNKLDQIKEELLEIQSTYKK